MKPHIPPSKPNGKEGHAQELINVHERHVQLTARRNEQFFPKQVVIQLP